MADEPLFDLITGKPLEPWAAEVMARKPAHRPDRTRTTGRDGPGMAAGPHTARAVDTIEGEDGMTTRQPGSADALREALAGPVTRFYIDCEFDGHDGPLLSIALVREDGDSIHIRADVEPLDLWVRRNVLPLMDSHQAPKSATVYLKEVGGVIRAFIGDCKCPVIVADSPVDIGRFCRALSTGPDGGWVSADYPQMRFEVHNVDCYPTTLPGAVQHNAWWDAMALRAKLNPAPGLLATIDTQAARIAELEAENARLREALAWVPDVYPYKRGEVGAHVEMTWEQFNAMREALGLAPLPDPALTKGHSHD